MLSMYQDICVDCLFDSNSQYCIVVWVCSLPNLADLGQNSQIQKSNNIDLNKTRLQLCYHKKGLEYLDYEYSCPDTKEYVGIVPDFVILQLN